MDWNSNRYWALPSYVYHENAAECEDQPAGLYAYQHLHNGLKTIAIDNTITHLYATVQIISGLSYYKEDEPNWILVATHTSTAANPKYY